MSSATPFPDATTVHSTFEPSTPVDSVAHLRVKAAHGLDAIDVHVRIGADPHLALRLLASALDEARARIWEDSRA